MGKQTVRRIIAGALLALLVLAVMPISARAEQYNIKVFIWEKFTRQWVPYTSQAVGIAIGDIWYVIQMPLVSGEYSADIMIPPGGVGGNRVVVWVGPNRYNEFTYQADGGPPSEPGVLGGLEIRQPHNAIKVYVKAMY